MWRVLFIMLVWSGAALAQDAGTGAGQGRVSDLNFRVEDLTFRIDGVQGKAQDLQVKETAQELRIELAADILFDFDKADLRPQAQQALKQVAQIIRDRAKGSVVIEGYTDAKGSDRYNQRLSERRAQSVRKWLIEREGLRVKMTARGYGKNKPVAPNTKLDGSDNPEGRQKNRRVEVVIRKS
jgi:outer membrane protein OmpA-like peptidoglycan-associated protein